MGPNLSPNLERPKKAFPLSPSGPSIVPPRLATPKKVVLADDLLKRVDQVAKFYDDVFRKMGAKDPSTSRTEVVDEFMRWAIDQFWKDRGGEPQTGEERSRRVAQYAGELEKQAEKSNS